MSRDRRLLSVWALLVLGLAVRAFAGGLLAADQVPGVVATPHRVDLQRAGIAELQVLPGIGPTRAVAIVLERLRRGPFRGPEDLGRVDGIGPATAAALSPWLAPMASELAGSGSAHAAGPPEAPAAGSFSGERSGR